MIKVGDWVRTGYGNIWKIQKICGVRYYYNEIFESYFTDYEIGTMGINNYKNFEDLVMVGDYLKVRTSKGETKVLIIDGLTRISVVMDIKKKHVELVAIYPKEKLEEIKIKEDLK